MYNEDISVYIEDALEDMKTSGVPPDILNGTDKNGFRNAEKMGYLEYGVRSHGQEPRPVRAAAVAQSKNAVMQVMEEVIGAEVDKL